MLNSSETAQLKMVQPDTVNQKKMLDLRTVAEELNISVNGLRNIINRRELKSVRVGNSIRIQRADLEAYILANTK